MSPPVRWHLHEAGDRGFFVNAATRVPPETLRSCAAHLTTAKLAGVLDVVPGTARVLVIYDPLQITARQLRPQLEHRLASPPLASASAPPTLITLPVLYTADAGPDLLPLAAAKGITVPELIARHTAPLYTCRMLGFRPGFPYLDGLDARLATARRATPRVRVPAGSVAIGGPHTGVYPDEGPGGWHLIGRTTATLFDAQRDRPFLITPGDRVRFVAAPGSVGGSPSRRPRAP